MGDPVAVPAGADEAMLETCRSEVQRRLDSVTVRAYEIVDRKERHVGHL